MHDYECPDCGFRSTGHETKKSMLERKAQHEREHKTGEPTPELADFRAALSKKG